MMSRSLFPLASCSRISFLRSTARPACESAMVWFWHTRQRSFVARSMVRASSAGLSAAGGASPALTAPTNASTSASIQLLLTLELFGHRDDFLLQHLVGDRADALVP